MDKLTAQEWYDLYCLKGNKEYLVECSEDIDLLDDQRLKTLAAHASRALKELDRYLEGLGLDES